MNVVILDPYFETLGGGEKVVAAIAEHLAKKHDVTILVKHPVNKKQVSEYFNVDLQKVNFRQLPQETFFVRAATSRYAKLPGRWKNLIYDYGSLKALKKFKADLFINSLYQSSLPSPAAKSLYICMFPQKLQPGNIYHNDLRRAYNRITTSLEQLFLGSRQQTVDSYTVVAANSKYTAGWVKKYWHRDAEVLYPICDDMGPPAAKKNIILNVGRFFADNGSSHHKRQDELIKAFIKLDRADWELHLAGSTGGDKESQQFMSELQRLAQGHSNIFIHPNMPFGDLKKLRRQAAIYWHATGFGYNAEIFPENQEHFGMVTAEAMSAGAVPVVYNSAGQKEVVTDGKDGLLWSDIDELLSKTTRLIDNKPLQSKLGGAAIKRSRDFDKAKFQRKLDQIIALL